MIELFVAFLNAVSSSSQPGARFSKVPKLYGPFSGPLYLKNGQDLSRQTSLPFFFLYIEDMSKDRLSKISACQFHKWLFGTFEKRVLREGTFFIRGGGGCAGVF